MAALQQAVRAVCLLLLLDSLLQMLFPKGSWQSCLRLISGLLMAVLLLQPVAALKSGELPLPLPFTAAAADTVSPQRAQSSGAQLLATLSASAGRQQQQLLADQAAALARLATGAESVDSWWEDEVLHLHLQGAAAVDTRQLRQDIAFLLQVAEESIEVSIDGGSE